MTVSPDPFQADTRSVASTQIAQVKRKEDRSLNKQALNKIQKFD